MRHILVTGGNRGIGLAIVKGMAAQSEDTVLLGCRNLDEGRRIAREIGKKNIVPVRLDLSERTTLAAQITQILQEFSPIDVLINNAGILYDGHVLDMEMGKFDEVLRVNTLAPLELMRACVPGMQAQNYGRIVNLSSGWGAFDEGLSGPFSYAFSKAALNALTLILARELKANVKVNAMCPGWVRTRMGGQMASRSPEEGAATAIWLANLPAEGPSGGFYRDKKRIEW